jgi:hypothetical protein
MESKRTLPELGRHCEPKRHRQKVPIHQTGLACQDSIPESLKSEIEKNDLNHFKDTGSASKDPR